MTLFSFNTPTMIKSKKQTSGTLSDLTVSGDVVAFILRVTVIIGSSISSSFSATNKLVIPGDIRCACPGDVLTFTCTAVGPGSTLWEGSAFECNENGDGILLRHERFATGVSGTCNNGAIVGRSLEVVDDCYTSQLNVTVSSDLNNKTLVCTNSGNAGVNTIGSTALSIMQGPYPPPTNVHLSDVSATGLAFSWSAPFRNCSLSVAYGISSDCGSCSGTTTTTNTTCSNLQLTSEAQFCTFSVRSMICGSLGELSAPIMLTLKVPSAPTVAITPVYSNENQSLVNFNLAINQADPFMIADGVSGTTLNYLIRLNSSYGVAKTISRDTCGSRDVQCEYTIEAPSSICLSPADISVTISAINSLGEGSVSRRSIVGCKNQFVTIVYSSATRTIICSFQNPLDASNKSCSVQYGRCDQMFTQTVSVDTSSNNVSLKLSLSDGASYCYIVTASNDSYVVIVEGRILIDTTDGTSTARIIVPVVVGVLLIILLVLVAVIILGVIMHLRRSSRKYIPFEEFRMKEKPRFTEDDLVHLSLKPVDTNERLIERYVVSENCSLKEFLEGKNVRFERGCTYYEFDGDVESITEDTELIFMANETFKMFNPDVDAEELRKRHLIGESVLKPSLDSYNIFIQSTGLGSRHLAPGSNLLYERMQPHPLWRVNRDEFEWFQLHSDSTLGDLRKTHEQGLNFDIFLELGADKKDEKVPSGETGLEIKEKDEILDVVLLDKDTKWLLTGPSGHRMVKEYRRGLVEINRQRWRVFLLSNLSFDDNLKLKKNTWVLYHEYSERQQLSKGAPLIHIKSDQLQLKILSVNIQLSKFCDQHNLAENGKNLFVEVGKVPVKGDQTLVNDMILVDKETRKLYTGPSTLNVAEHFQTNVDNGLSQWRVFVLHEFNEDILLLKNSSVLFPLAQSFFHKQLRGIMPVISESFQTAELKLGGEVDGFLKQKTVFLEVGCFQPMDTTKSDVILMDKVHDSRLFTGPGARQLVANGMDSAFSNMKWKVFVPCKLKEDMTCLKDTTVLHQSEKIISRKFTLLEVDEDNIRLSVFVKSKLGCNSFENGRAFYEFNQEEDLLYYKEVVLLPTNKDNIKNLLKKKEVSCEVRSFYDIPGVPGLAVKPASLKFNTKVFLQSTSHGSRCLKRRALVLYRV